MELIPAIDLRNGRVVRLFQGDFAAETRYELSPIDLYGLYLRSGAARIHVVDLDGARDGRVGNRDIVASLAALGTARIQSGGGLRSAEDVRALLATGVDRAVIGSVAVTATDEVAGWLGEFGPDRLVVALDVRIDESGVPRVASHGWREQSALSLWDIVGQLGRRGLRHALCTDVSRDGALTGPNLPLYREAMRRFPTLSWQASGGIRDVADLEALAGLELAAAVSGKALIEGRISPAELRPFLPGA